MPEGIGNVGMKIQMDWQSVPEDVLKKGEDCPLRRDTYLYRPTYIASGREWIEYAEQYADKFTGGEIVANVYSEYTLSQYLDDEYEYDDNGQTVSSIRTVKVVGYDNARGINWAIVAENPHDASNPCYFYIPRANINTMKYDVSERYGNYERTAGPFNAANALIGETTKNITSFVGMIDMNSDPDTDKEFVNEKGVQFPIQSKWELPNKNLQMSGRSSSYYATSIVAPLGGMEYTPTDGIKIVNPRPYYAAVRGTVGHLYKLVTHEYAGKLVFGDIYTSRFRFTYKGAKDVPSMVIPASNNLTAVSMDKMDKERITAWAHSTDVFNHADMGWIRPDYTNTFKTTSEDAGTDAAWATEPHYTVTYAPVEYKYLKASECKDRTLFNKTIHIDFNTLTDTLLNSNQRNWLSTGKKGHDVDWKNNKLYTTKKWLNPADGLTYWIAYQYINENTHVSENNLDNGEAVWYIVKDNYNCKWEHDSNYWSLLEDIKNSEDSVDPDDIPKDEIISENGYGYWIDEGGTRHPVKDNEGGAPSGVENLPSDDSGESWWEIYLNPGSTGGYPPEIDQGTPTTNDTVEMLDLSYDLDDALRYELQYQDVNAHPYGDTRHVEKINRFRITEADNGLATKSFVFMTRPDLNIYQEDREGNVDQWNMNEDLKRLPTFKYIARLKGACARIPASLEYDGTHSMNTPWLSIIHNQCMGYNIINRELDTVEMGETFHGNKIIYAEPTFKHKIAGTVEIPFHERSDLSLYYTLKMWVEYIQTVTMGYCSPRRKYITDGILDYAVSLFYITTDITMENILYWEKLTGVFPLTVPDSFFSWTKGTNEREMDYSIQFAYSFRSIQEEQDLLQINRLYNNPMKTITPSSYIDQEYVFDSDFNGALAKIAASYGQLPVADYNNINPEDTAIINALMKDNSRLGRYYYGNVLENSVSNYTDSSFVHGQGYNVLTSDGTTNKYIKAWFLPNWIPMLRMHGIPYVKGPFITSEDDSGKYKLRWV